MTKQSQKLQYFIYEALNKEYDTIITVGGNNIIIVGKL